MSFAAEIVQRPPHVLIVDDELHNRELLLLMLASEGLTLTTASSGEEALAAVRESPPDLIVLDVMMPGMDGNQVAAAIKGKFATRNIPIIMLTVLEDLASRLLGLNAGVETFLTRPVDRGELCLRVRNLLRLKAYSNLQDSYSHMLEHEVGARTADLADSEELYRSIFETAPIGLVQIGADGQWLRVNKRVCDLLGYSEGELMVANVKALLDAEIGESELDAFKEMAAGKLDGHVVEERRFRRQDGRSVWARVKMSVHRSPEGQFQQYIMSIEDMTERRELEAQVRQASKMDAIGQLAAGVAHDFNNILSVILTYSDLLAMDLKEGDPMRVDLAEIKTAGRRAVALTQQLLAVSRQQVLQPRVVDLVEIVGGMEKMLRRLIGEDVELIATLSPVSGRVLVDPGQMDQILMNLAVNARDAMPQGGKLIIDVTEVVVDRTDPTSPVGEKAGPHVMLAVADTGGGMSKETQARIFEPFFTTKEIGKGTGLGLATVFGIVRQSGGTIAVFSELGKGTVFKIYFPTVDGTAVAQATAPLERPTLRGSETVLLVEDEEGVRVAARTILLKYGYQVLDAQNGGDAFLLCEQHEGTIHLLLTDMVMPRMSGRQLAERLAVLRPEMKVLYMSGYTDDTVVRNGIQDSTIAFIPKPFTPQALAGAVRQALSKAG